MSRTRAGSALVLCALLWSAACGSVAPRPGDGGASVDGGASADGGTGVRCVRATDCLPGEFCQLVGCGAGSAGQCKPRQVTCTAEVAPVCGCDGRTYNNACLAQAAGMSLAQTGACADGGSGGGSCSASSPCAVTSWCDFGASTCGAAASLGVCKPRPDVCTREYAPVCGCDGVTYANECTAQHAGVDVASLGECPGDARCTSSVVCARGTFCDWEANTCGASGTEGRCRPLPQVCPAAPCEPVCGCDGNTYCSACAAHAAGVDVARAGACAPVACSASAPCGASEYCDSPAGTCGGAGVCRLRPRAESCGTGGGAVCGCDGRDYASVCLAAAAGTAVQVVGSCATARPCTSSSACAATSYCDFTPNTCGASGSGRCTPRPEGCTTEYMPVCGCDGMTYSNACVAAIAGVDVVANVACEEPIVCATGRACPPGRFCNYGGGVCGEGGVEGLCDVPPTACPRVYAPVCGCDGRTYSNECFARAAGVSAGQDGPCETVCGGRGNPPCEESQYCDFEPASCGRADETGICRARPDSCPTGLPCQPVCGCDGNTYCSACEAALAGSDVASTGACAPSTDTCSMGRTCASGYACDFALDSCGLAGEVGRCVVRPQVCPAICRPTCGCDGVTYCSGCDALAHGTDTAHDGACSATGQFCGGFLGTPCPADYYCDYPDNSCGAADASGVCAPIPEVCAPVSQPVCGCDGRRYDNACAAAVAGVDVQVGAACGS